MLINVIPIYFCDFQDIVDRVHSNENLFAFWMEMRKIVNLSAARCHIANAAGVKTWIKRKSMLIYIEAFESE